MKKEIEQKLKVVQYNDILKEINKELGNIYGIEVIADILDITKNVLIRHILYTPFLKLNLLNIADLFVYEDKIPNPTLLEKGASENATYIKIVPKSYIKKFVKKKNNETDITKNEEKLLKNGSLNIDNNNVDIDFL